MKKDKLNSALGLNTSSPFMKQITPHTQTYSEDEQVVPTDDVDEAAIVPRKSAAPLSEQDIITDIDYVRRTLQFSTERAQQLVDLAIRNAGDASNPRDIEVASGALNTCANISEKLLSLYKTTKEIQRASVQAGSGNTFINNNNKTIVLSSSELLKQLTDNEEEDDV